MSDFMENIPSTRAAAQAAGVRHYRSEKPCKRGHTPLRYASTGGCVECGKESQKSPEAAEYRKKTSARAVLRAQEWRANNRERHDSSLRAYYIKNKNKILESGRAYREKNADALRGWYERNKDAIRERTRAWYNSRSPEQIEKTRVVARERARKYRHNKRTRMSPEQIALEREQRRVKTNEWRKNNRYKTRVYTALRRKRTPKWVTKDTLNPFYLYAQMLSLTEGEKYEVDHFVPISKGGLNVPCNLHIITHRLNKDKRDKMPHAFYGERYEEVKAQMIAQQVMIMGITKDKDYAQYSVAA